MRENTWDYFSCVSSYTLTHIHFVYTHKFGEREEKKRRDEEKRREEKRREERGRRRRREKESLESSIKTKESHCWSLKSLGRGEKSKPLYVSYVYM